MADWLLIRLSHAMDGTASFLVADAAGRIMTAAQKGTLAQAAALAGGRRVRVLVPGADVVLTAADVPNKAGVKVQQVVPFALEEHLADDVDGVHFALGRRSTELPKLPVAVVARSLMQEWLAALTAAGLAPEKMFADSSLIPANPGQSVALLEGDSVTVRAPGGAPLTLPLDALGEALELARPPRDEALAEQAASGLVLYTGPQEWQQCSREVEAARDKFEGIKVQLLSDGPLALFAQQLPTAAGAIDLLQGGYAPTTAFASSWKAWRIAAALLGALVALHALGSTAELLALKRTERKLDVSIADAFRAAMPGEHNATNARRRMEQRLSGLRGSDASGLLAALGALAQARGTAPGISVRALVFRDGALELRVLAPNADALDHMSQALRATGWQAELTGGSPAGGAYEGRMQIKPQA